MDNGKSYFWMKGNYNQDINSILIRESYRSYKLLGIIKSSGNKLKKTLKKNNNICVRCIWNYISKNCNRL